MSDEHHRLLTMDQLPELHDQIDAIFDNTDPTTNCLAADLADDPYPNADHLAAMKNDRKRQEHAETALTALEAVDDDDDTPEMSDIAAGKPEMSDITADKNWGATDLNDELRWHFETQGRLDEIAVDVTAWTDINGVLSWLAPEIIEVEATMRAHRRLHAQTHTVRCQCNHIRRTRDGRWLAYYECEVVV